MSGRAIGVVGLLAVAALVGLLALGAAGLNADAKRKEIACAKSMNLAATRRDTMDVVMRCEIPEPYRGRR